MIEITREKLTNAIARAKQVKPTVRWTGDRNFEVSGSKGNVYAVSLVVVNGKKLASCGCEAHRKGNVCYHLAAASFLNVVIQTMKRNAVN